MDEAEEEEGQFKVATEEEEMIVVFGKDEEDEGGTGKGKEGRELGHVSEWGGRHGG